MTEPEIDIVKHIAELRENAAAGAALVTVAVVDEWLLRLLLTAMRPLSNKMAERMFGSYGPLYEVAPKADMAFAFRLIDETTLIALRALNAIRNHFAHSRDLLTFKSSEVIDLCRALPGWKEGTDAMDLFDDVAVDCVRAIDAKTQELLFKDAISEPSPGKSET